MSVDSDCDALPGPPPVSEIITSNNFNPPIMLRIMLIVIDGINNGKVIFLNFCQGLRSEEHTSELQSRFDLVCRLLLEKKNDKIIAYSNHLVSTLCQRSRC